MSDFRPLIEAIGISKRYGKTQALTDVHFDLVPGEIHAMLGENGAGKSTLVKILAGTEQYDEGEVRILGEQMQDYDAAKAAGRGLFVVHQELSLVGGLSIAENICLNRFPQRFSALSRVISIIDRRELRRRSEASLRQMDFHADVDSKVQDLDQAEQQVVEICRALASEAQIILLDEPTSSLAPNDRERLYNRIRAVADSGVALVLITHNLHEALGVADRISVLRDGHKVATVRREEVQVENIIEMMTGMAPGRVFPARNVATPTAVRLSVNGLKCLPRVHDVSLDLRQGEIVGLAGLVGAGRTEVMKCLYGQLPRTAGAIQIDGRDVALSDPVAAMRAGVFMIPEDRQGEGIIPTASILWNMAVSNIVSRGDIDGTAPMGVLRWPRIRRMCEDMRETIRIKAASLDDSILTLSGGNQQKVILARCLLTSPQVILADEPTRGVSIGSKVEIYKVLRDLAAEGVSILIASSEFDELIGLCNRIYLIDHGRTVGVVDNQGVGSDELLNLVLTSSSHAPQHVL